MSNKRGADGDSGGSGEPPLKKVQFEPIRIGPISTLEEMDIKVLQFQNKKLAQRIEQRNRLEADLRQRIEQLEKRQTQDDAVLNVVNRYWNQLNEDIRVLLQRFDAETADESENKNECEATTSFLMQLSTWDKEELDEKLANRVQVSKRAVAKVIQAFDRLMQRNEKITLALKGELDGDEAPNVDEVIRQANIEVQAENHNLQSLNTSLHKKYHTISLKMAELQERVTGKETEAAELLNRVDDLQYELTKAQSRNDKLENHLAEAMEKVKACQQLHGDEKGVVKPVVTTTVSQKKTLEMGLACETCGKSFSQQKTLNRHRRETHEMNPTLHECLKCGKKFIRKSDVDRHTTTVHAKQQQPKMDEADSFECGDCGKLFKTRNALTNHLRIHNKAYPCGKCGKLFSAPGRQYKHQQFNCIMEELQKEIEEVRELANNRLQELDKLHLQHREALKEVEKLKMDIRQLPESVIVETTEYKCLQSQFSVLYNESMQLKTQLDEARLQLHTSKNAHLRQIEMMESEELMAQKKLRTEVIQLEDLLAQLRKEYEMLRIEFEQNLAANEQTGPINREMRHLITSLQNHNQQLKGEVHRYKRKYKEANAEIPKLKKDIEDLNARVSQLPGQDLKEFAGGLECKEEESNQSTAGTTSVEGGGKVKEEPSATVTVKKEQVEEEPEVEDTAITEADKEKQLTSPTIKKEKDGTAAATPAASAGTPGGKREIKKEQHREQHRAKVPETEIVRDLKAQLKKALNDQKEMKLLLDMYKGASKEQRDKVQLMASEKKIRAELEETRQQLKKILESKREERKKLADEDALRKIKHLEEQAYQLQKQVATHKQGVCWQEEEALLNEMEVTGQAFEDMQEQNSRLIQQLREKDDANFKLMTERIKSNQLHKLAREEKDVLKEQVGTITMQVEATNIVVRKLEEKERILQNSLATAEKELALRQQAMEMHKRKAIESAQSAADLKLHLEKYHSQMKEAQQVVTEKTSSLEAEAYKTKRLQEEIVQFRRRTERMKKIELAGTLDEVMIEEIREYKETLTCPSCKVKRKDAVLTKCFHVFCYDCLRTRYETRQRKCPKCNAAFGANDYHRLYLGS